VSGFFLIQLNSAAFMSYSAEFIFYSAPDQFIFKFKFSATQAPVKLSGEISPAKFDLDDEIQNFLTFFPRKNSKIDSLNFIVDSDENREVTGFYANRHEPMEYLPVKIDEKFPNLIFLEVTRSSIKELSYPVFPL
jgi:hypothetical protein